MPISEDEYEYQKPNGQSAISKAEQRRNNKPIMEKRRRARINHCLNELKTLILDAMKKDPARHSKLEKADILEMTVKHLQTLQRQQLAVAVATDPSVLHKFKTGFNECAGEVSRYIGNMDAVETGVKQRLAAHLSNCVSGLQQVSPFTFPGVGGMNGTTSGNTNTIPDQKPAQQFQITSTSYSPESKQDLSLKIEYKAVPIYQPSEKHRDGNFKNFGSKSLEPLSVITADKSKMVAREQYEETINNFSRKRQYPSDVEGLLTLVRQEDTEASTSKFARCSIDDASISSSSATSSSSSGSPDQRVYALEGHFQRQQREQNNGQPEDVNNEPMWRPW
ncbi:deadpan [Carabus blaptoides fortunei]